MNFQTIVTVLVQILNLIDKFDEPVRQVLSLVSGLLPEKYATAIKWLLNYEPKVVSFFLDLTGQSEAKGGDGNTKLANALSMAIKEPEKPDKETYSFVDMLNESVDFVNVFLK